MFLTTIDCQIARVEIDIDHALHNKYLYEWKVSTLHVIDILSLEDVIGTVLASGGDSSDVSKWAASVGHTRI